jgi:hypothetical protein
VGNSIKITPMADKVYKKELESRLKELDKQAHEGHKMIEEGRKMQNKAAREAVKIRETLEQSDRKAEENGTK